MNHIESSDDDAPAKDQSDDQQLAIISQDMFRIDCEEFQPNTETLKCLDDSWTFKEVPSNPDDDKKVTMFIPNVNFMARRSELNYYLSDEG